MSGHVAIPGMTGSGKTTLAQAIAREWRRRGVNVLVLDPFRSPGWPAHWITDCLGAFLEKARRSKRCALFIEEAGNYGREPEFAWLFTQSRHWGHLTHYLTQYHSQVPPIVRTNCERLLLFRTSTYSAGIWAEEFAQPDILRLATALPRYHFVAAGRYEAPRACTLKV